MKVGDFAAITRGAGHRHKVEGSIFGENMPVAGTTMDQEDSGYFVEPTGRLPHGWRTVSAS